MARVVEIPLGFSFDDVLLVPQYSEIGSRTEVSTRSKLVRDIYIEAPIIASNMDTVTESEMGIALARVGGFPIIHRFLTIEAAVAEARRVKKYRAHVIDDPVEITADKTIGDAIASMRQHEIGGLMVVDEQHRLIGIITNRDIYSESRDRLISEVMTPRERMVIGRPGMRVEEASELMHEKRIEKLPLVDDATDHATGLIVMKDIRKLQDYPKASLDGLGRLLVGSSVGITGDYFERAEELIKVGSDVIAIDIAHGHSKGAIEATERIHKAFPDTPLIVGDVASSEGVIDLAKAGADAVRAGIGPGSACATRVVAGTGYPQLSALLDCAEGARKAGVALIADGGIKNSADLCKALAAGADTVILGSLLAGTPESPGKVVLDERGNKFKRYRGMASLEALMDKKLQEGTSEEEFEETNMTAAEGVETLIPLKEPVNKIVHQLLGGLRSGMSYSNAHTVEEFHEKALFVQMTSGGAAESRPHILER